ncbi:unnamed protein product [Arctogadus glacialis]
MGACVMEARVMGACVMEARVMGACVMEARVMGACVMEAARVMGACVMEARVMGACVMEAARVMGACVMEARAFVQRLSNLTGYSTSSLAGKKLWRLYDTLTCQRIHSLAPPLWATEELLEALREMTSSQLTFTLFSGQRLDKARLSGGILLNAILKNFSRAVEQGSALRFILYSAHDSTLLTLQAALDIYNGLLPPYASCQLFEFYQEHDGSFSLELFYRNESGRAPFPTPLPGCGGLTACPLTLVRALVREVLVDDVDGECGVKPRWASAGMSTALAVAVGVLAVALVVSIGVAVYRRPERS